MPVNERHSDHDALTRVHNEETAEPSRRCDGIQGLSAQGGSPAELIGCCRPPNAKAAPRAGSYMNWFGCYGERLDDEERAAPSRGGW